jgi:hypothetical protein
MRENGHLLFELGGEPEPLHPILTTREGFELRRRIKREIEAKTKRGVSVEARTEGDSDVGTD